MNPLTSPPFASALAVSLNFEYHRFPSHMFGGCGARGPPSADMIRTLHTEAFDDVAKNFTTGVDLQDFHNACEPWYVMSTSTQVAHLEATNAIQALRPEPPVQLTMSLPVPAGGLVPAGNAPPCPPPPATAKGCGGNSKGKGKGQNGNKQTKTNKQTKQITSACWPSESAWRHVIGKSCFHSAFNNADFRNMDAHTHGSQKHAYMWISTFSSAHKIGPEYPEMFMANQGGWTTGSSCQNICHLDILMQPARIN